MAPRGLGLALVVALLAFAGGYAVKGGRDRALLTEQARVTDSTLQAVTVLHARARDSLTRLRTAEVTRADGAEAEARRLRGRAAAHAAADRAGDSVLATLPTGADSLPVVVAQRDAVRLAYAELEVGFDSLLTANGALRRAGEQADSLAALASRDQAAREAALRALNQGLRLELEQAKGRGKFLGLVRLPGWSLILAGGVAGYLLKP
jgi:hypothetical protein